MSQPCYTVQVAPCKTSNRNHGQYFQYFNTIYPGRFHSESIQIPGVFYLAVKLLERQDRLPPLTRNLDFTNLPGHWTFTGPLKQTTPFISHYSAWFGGY